MPVITISKEFGAGGTDIGRKVAELLGFDLFDKELIYEIALRVGVDEKLVEEFDQERHSDRKAFISRFFELHPIENILNYLESYIDRQKRKELEEKLNRPVTPFDTTGCLDSEIYAKMMRELMYRLAAREKGVVIIGRGGQCILQNFPKTLHVRIVAPLEFRIQRVMELKNLSREEAENLIYEADLNSSDYIRHYHDAYISDPTLYHLVLNTAKLGLDHSAQTILWLWKQIF